MREVVDLIEKLEPGQVALYIDKGGLMHATDEKEHAMTYSVGKIMITDECEEKGGMPIFNGVKVEIWGAGKSGDTWVYLSKYAKSVDYKWQVNEESYIVPEGGSVSISHTDLSNKEKVAVRTAAEYYLELL